jgi:hypothetical protein
MTADTRQRYGLKKLSAWVICVLMFSGVLAGMPKPLPWWALYFGAVFGGATVAIFLAGEGQ